LPFADLARKIATIEYQLSRSNLGVSVHDKKRAEDLRSESIRREQTVAYLSALCHMRDVCQALIQAGNSKLPLESARGNILRLCDEPDNDLFTTYVRRQRGNWKKRLPPEYLQAIDQFLGLAAKRKAFWRRPPSGQSIEERITSGQQAVADTRVQLDQQLKAIKDSPAAARLTLERELTKLQMARAEAIASPLEVLRSMGLGAIQRTRPESRQSASVSGLFEYLSCFISYSSRDSEFAKRLHADLVRQGVKCWFAPENLRIGDRFRQQIDDSIRAHDKLLLVLSAESIRSAWVEAEVEAAFERERNEKRVVLFPIKLDDEVMNTQLSWAANIRRTRHIGDFRGSITGVAYESAISRLLHDLRTDAPSTPGSLS
jgi:TIR domain